ncbi:hypothetical protein [Erythrobacter alti]|uniref:hypothetical protein n=1 Tax=Erythrobacter alti TaxID=1896145 RepID=UPI0030F39999
MLGSGHPYSDPLEIALQRELVEGERVMWKARPLSRIMWTGFAIWLFAVPWTAFAVFWTVMAYAGVDSMTDGGSSLLAYAFPLFGLPFILVGLAMMSAPFAPLLWANRRMFAVTDRRVIELRLARQLQSKSVDLSELGAIERTESRDGSGYLKIAIGISRDSDGDRQIDYFKLGEVSDVMQADDAIRTARDRLAQSAPLPEPLSS